MAKKSMKSNRCDHCKRKVVQHLKGDMKTYQKEYAEDK